MELTQLQGQNPGQTVGVGAQAPVGIGSGPGNAINHPDLPPQAAQIATGPGEQKTITPINKSPVVVGGKSVSGPTPIKHGDTIGVGKGNQVILGAHAPGNPPGPGQVGEHLGQMNFSPAQISEITEKLFNVQTNKAVQKPLGIAGGILVALVGVIVFSFMKLSDLNAKIVSSSKDLKNQISSAQSSLESVKTALGVELEEDFEDECDPDFDDCDDMPSGDSSSIDERITKLNTNISSTKNKLGSLEKQFDKVEKDLMSAIDSALTGSGSEVLQTLISKKIEQGPIKQMQSDLSEAQSAIDSFKKELIAEISAEIGKMQKDINSVVEYREDLRALKEVNKFMKDFEADNAVVDKRIKLVETDAKENKKEIDSLIKEDSTIDSEIKKVTDRLNSIELQIKNMIR